MRCSWLIPLVLLAACSREAPTGYRRIVLLPVENLTAEPARGVDAEAIRMAIWESLQAQPALQVTLAAHRRNLPDLPSSLVVDGYLAPERFQLRVNEQPVLCSGTLESCTGPVVAAVAKVAGVTPRAIPNVDSLRQLARAGAGYGSLEGAAKADPLFASLWLGWAGQAQGSGGPGAAMEVLRQAPLDRMPAFDAARIRVRMAEFGQDRKLHAKELGELARLSPADVELQERAASEAMAVGAFEAAQSIYERLLVVSRHPRVLGFSARAAMFLGDRGKADSLASEAAAALPGEPAVAETRGDIACYFGDFAGASRFYEQSAGVNVTYQGGLPLWKAAETARMAGDKARAEALFHRYEEIRTQAGMRNPLLLQAIWEWRGDQPDSAIEKFRLAAQTTERGKALFLLSLTALNRKNLAAAAQVMNELEPNSAERAFLQSLLTGAPPPAGLPVPAEALRVLHLYIRGDEAGASAALAAARVKIDATQDGPWRMLAARLEKKKPAGILPASPDDWMSILLR